MGYFGSLLFLKMGYFEFLFSQNGLFWILEGLAVMKAMLVDIYISKLAMHNQYDIHERNSSFAYTQLLSNSYTLHFFLVFPKGIYGHLTIYFPLPFY